MHEFNIITKYFAHISPGYIGDDCAELDISKLDQLLITSDTLVSGVHFYHDVCAKSLGHKSLVVSLSDIAAMGGQAQWFTLALTLPEELVVPSISNDAGNNQWLNNFSAGLSETAQKYNVHLVGGDVTKGPLSITITVLGYPSVNVLNRASAEPGDGIFVTGSLGEPIATLENKLDNKLDRKSEDKLKLHYPEPRLRVGQKISSFAHAAIDISDGLLADLQHILNLSNVSAEIKINQLPLAESIKKFGLKTRMRYALTGGDEYELLFTAPLDKIDDINKVSIELGVKISHIGTITPKMNSNVEMVNQSIKFIDQNNNIIDLALSEYDCWQHFKK